MSKAFLKQVTLSVFLTIAVFAKAYAEEVPLDSRCEIPSASGMTAICGTLVSNLFERETISGADTFTKANFVKGATVAIYTRTKNGYYAFPFASTSTNDDGFFRIEVNQSLYIENNEAYLAMFCGDKRVSITKFNVTDPSGNTSNNYFMFTRMSVPCSKLTTYDYRQPPKRLNIAVKEGDFLGCTVGSMKDNPKEETPIDNSKFTDNPYTQTFSAGDKVSFVVPKILGGWGASLITWIVGQGLDDYFSVAGDNKTIYADPVKTGSWNCFAGGCAAEGLGLLENKNYESGKSSGSSSTPDLAPCENYKAFGKTLPEEGSPLNRQYGGYMTNLTMSTVWLSQCEVADLTKGVCKDRGGADITLGEIQPPSIYSRGGWSENGSYKLTQEYFSPVMCDIAGPAVTKVENEFVNASLKSGSPMDYTYASETNQDDRFQRPAKSGSFKVSFPGSDGVIASPVLGSNLSGGGTLAVDASNLLSLPKFSNKLNDTITGIPVGSSGRKVTSMDNPIAGCSVSKVSTENLSGFYDKYYVNNKYAGTQEPVKGDSALEEATKLEYNINSSIKGINAPTTNIFVPEGATDGQEPSAENLKVYEKSPKDDFTFQGFVSFFKSIAALIRQLMSGTIPAECVQEEICHDDNGVEVCELGDYNCNIDRTFPAELKTEAKPAGIYDQSKMAQAGDKLMMNLLMPNKQFAIQAGSFTESDMSKRTPEDKTEEARKMDELKNIPVTTGDRDIYTTLSSMPLNNEDHSSNIMYFHCEWDGVNAALVGNIQTKELKKIGSVWGCDPDNNSVPEPGPGPEPIPGDVPPKPSPLANPGSCPVGRGVVSCGSYGTSTYACPDGHGGDAYWRGMGTPYCRYALPALRPNTSSSWGCPGGNCGPSSGSGYCGNINSKVPWYGLAADYVSTESGRPVYAPSFRGLTSWKIVSWKGPGSTGGVGGQLILDGMSSEGHVVILMMHMGGLYDLSEGSTVTPGNPIGYYYDWMIGSSDNSHVHVEIKVNEEIKQPETSLSCN